MTAAAFTENVLPTRDYAQYTSKARNPVAYWMHQHPRIVKVALQALGAIGVAGIGLGWGSTVAVVGGAAILVVSLVARKVLNLFIPPTHDPAHHVYEEMEIDGGTLKYQGDVPVLTVTAEEPHKAGYACGYLTADGIAVVREKMEFALYTLARFPQPDQLPRFLDRVYQELPEEYQQELQGLVDGYNARRKSWAVKGAPLTLPDAIAMHLLPDKLHLDHHDFERKLIWEDSGEFGCTVIVDGNEETGPVFARNLDWQSVGAMGTYSLILRREDRTTGTRTVELSFPGMLGTLTGMNQHGLVLAMNVCNGETDDVRGIPAVFYNRRCLQSCESVDGVHLHVSEHRPLGPYHLSTADANRARTFHLYQDEGSHYMRNWNGDTPLFTTNFRYASTGQTRPTISNSPQREVTLRAYFRDRLDSLEPEEHEMSRGAAARRALSLPEVNNIRTVHTAVMHPRTREMDISFNNGWSASLPRIPVDTSWLNEGITERS